MVIMNQSRHDSTKNIKKRPRVTFTAEEDELILYYAKIYGSKKWSLIAKYVNNRTAKQCRDRYMNHLRPGLSNIEWTQDEDDLLMNLFDKYGSKWSAINKFFDNRNQISLKNRMVFLLKNINKSHKNNDVDSLIQQKNEEKNKNTKIPLPDIKSDSKSNINDDSEIQKEQMYFNFDTMFESSDEFSSFSIFNGENDFDLTSF